MISQLDLKRMKPRYNFALVEYFAASFLLASCAAILNNGGLSFKSSQTINMEKEKLIHEYIVEEPRHDSRRREKKILKPNQIELTRTQSAEEKLIQIDDYEVLGEDLAGSEDSFGHHTHRIGCYLFCRNQKKSVFVF